MQDIHYNVFAHITFDSHRIAWWTIYSRPIINVIDCIRHSLLQSFLCSWKIFSYCHIFFFPPHAQCCMKLQTQSGFSLFLRKFGTFRFTAVLPEKARHIILVLCLLNYEMLLGKALLLSLFYTGSPHMTTGHTNATWRAYLFPMAIYHCNIWANQAISCVPNPFHCRRSSFEMSHEWLWNWKKASIEVIFLSSKVLGLRSDLPRYPVFW